MSKFLKFIVHFIVICTIVCVVGLAAPPFFGVTTEITDDSGKETNLPEGSVTYAIPTKTADAAFEHIHAIETIDAHFGLDYLDDRLKEIAELRIENPEATLKELGELLIPPMGKSGVNHRLKKIIEIAEQINKRKDS